MRGLVLLDAIMRWSSRQSSPGAGKGTQLISRSEVDQSPSRAPYVAQHPDPLGFPQARKRRESWGAVEIHPCPPNR
jgi:hypothetical protein